MSKLQAALDLAALGYHVFPLEAGSKLPHIDAFQKRASRDPAQIKSWWTDPVLGLEQDFNIGISTSHFGDDQALLVVDVDKKGDKDGDQALLTLELEGFTLSDTTVATTPTGGRHHLYVVERALRQSAGALGPGLDTRSRGGYICAAGSQVDAGQYVWSTDQRTPSPAPSWLVERFRVDDASVPGSTRPRVTSGISVDARHATDRALSYLDGLTLVTEGERNHKGYQVAAYIKDLGVEESECVAMMSHRWKCSPPLDIPELEHVVHSAYTYGRSEPGSAAPEKQFTPLTEATAQKAGVAGSSPAGGDHPFDILNREFAFVLAGGGSHILWETVDYHGRPTIEHLSITSFHQKFASWTIQTGKKNVPVTEEWMRHPSRRSYDGICFDPSAGPEVIIK